MTQAISHAASASLDSPSEERVNLAIGRRLRRRRKLLGLTQTEIANALGIRFQQVQKYECSASRISAAKLYFLARVLKVPINYFFDQLPADTPSSAAEKVSPADSIVDLLAEKETLNLLSSYAKLPVAVRQKLRAFASSLGEVVNGKPMLGDAS